MKCPRHRTVPILAVLLASAASPSQAQSVAAVIDSVFAPWNRTDGPGCTVGVEHDGKRVTRAFGMADLEDRLALESGSILAGVTRDILIERMPEIVVRVVREDELRAASEVMLVGTLSMVTAITRLDGRAVGDGGAGPVARRMLRELCEAVREVR